MSQPEALSSEGTVVAVAADRGHRFSKPTRDRIVLLEGHGVEGDAHAGPFVRHRYLARRRPRVPNLRQVHLIPSELFRSLSEAGFAVAAGDLGENITTTGLDLERMPLGTLIEFGHMAMIELTGLRTPCVLIDRNGPSIQMWGAGRGTVRRTGRGRRRRAGSAAVLPVSRLAGSVIASARPPASPSL